MREIPTDPAVMDQWAAPEQPEWEHNGLIDELSETLRRMYPRRIESDRDIKRYNVLQARLEGRTFTEIATEIGMAQSTVHGWIQEYRHTAPAIAHILRRPRHRWIAGT